ncbi:hypothetical protein RUE5091_03103 [Ruegeria denitrificans]|uniref:Uncharacterized protein n=1 Tax=Ruegeria denitrificans TaxID=1715692 RepID=A0A0P1IES1_9RHOB|nr:hypothetical protein RUE5091_03103 [Ruegeria denitrificans]
MSAYLTRKLGGLWPNRLKFSRTRAMSALSAERSFAATCFNFYFADKAPIRCGCAYVRLRCAKLELDYF